MSEQAKKIIESKEEVKKALADISSEETHVEQPKVDTSDKLWFLSYIFLLLGFAGIYYAIKFNIFDMPPKLAAIILRFNTGGVYVVLLLATAKATSVYLIDRIQDHASRFNLKRILKLVSVLIAGFIIISTLFVNWYGAMVSLGILSLILGFALQTPISSFIGWIYILVRTPYRVGDRIRVGEITGDVIDVGYLDTTLWEFGGEYLSTDHPSGRLIKFPNTTILSQAVYNYSWPLFPYIWNEVRFQVAYTSDLEFIATTMRKVVEQELGEMMMERVRTYRQILAKTPVNQIEVREHPTVFFRVSEYAWVDAIVRYVVPPREAGRIKNRLIIKLLEALNKEPDKVMFPKGTSR